MVAQFTLVYGNNWLVLPCPQPVGSLAEVLGIVVTDVLGQHTFVKSATHGHNTDWSRWESSRSAGATRPSISTRTC